jgi:hypothetical protein
MVVAANIDIPQVFCEKHIKFFIIAYHGGSFG